MAKTLDELPDDENGDVLRRMLHGGDDLTKARDIDFSVIFPTKSAAEEFADRFRRSGLKVTIHEWDGYREQPWDVTVTRHMLPSHAEITRMEETLEQSATPLGGRNDGWGCISQSVVH
jgi:hypothetical protein